MEVFNECSIIMLTYSLMMFTDFVPDPETRFTIGTFYITTSLSNVVVHLLILLKGSGMQIKNWGKRK